MSSSEPADTRIPPGGALFQALFDQDATGIAVISVEGRFLLVNRALCRMTGYSEAEMLERSFQDITHPADLESNEEFRRRLLSGEAQTRTLEKRYVRKDGSSLWVQIMATTIPDESGGHCSVGIIDDVTSLKQAQQALEQSEGRFRSMVELGSDWYWEQDKEFRFIRLPGLEKAGLDANVVIGKQRWEIEDLGPLPDKVWEQHRAVHERHEPFSDFTFLRHDKAGRLRYLSSSGKPLFDAEGRFRGYHGIGKDVTEKVEAQKALEESERRYRMLFDIHPHPMWVVDARTLAFLAVNEEAIRLYGYSHDEFLAMTADQIRPEEDVAELIKAFQDRSRTYRQRVWRHRKKNGDLMEVEIVSFNLEFDGRHARLGVIDDISERLKAEQRVREIEARYEALLRERGAPAT
jgi:PAS domain S-box-containing protein